MAKKKTYKTKEEKVKVVKEPAVAYQSSPKLGDIYKTITIATLEEMEDDNRLYWIQLTPEQRLNEHLQMIKHFFGIKDKVLAKIDKHIIFD